jgi:hypothetical protein
MSKGKGNGSDLWTISKIPVGLRRGPEAIERRFGKIGKTYPKLTFDKDRVVGYSDIEFVGPGHPLFEIVIDRVLTQYGEALRTVAPRAGSSSLVCCELPMPIPMPHRRTLLFPILHRDYTTTRLYSPRNPRHPV